MNIIIINCFDTYESRVNLLQKFFVEKGHQVNVYTSNFRHFQKCVRTDAPEEYHLIKTLPYQKNLSPQRIISHIKFAKDVRKCIEKKVDEIDLLWVMLPPNSLAKELSRLRKRDSRMKLIFDIIDVWPETMPVSGLEKLPPIQYWKKLRDQYIGRADLVVTECKLFQEKIKDYVSDEKLVNLYFAKKDENLPEKKNAVQLAVNNIKNDRFELCYLGSINNIVDIEVIGKIIKQLRGKKPVKLHVIGDGERREELLDTARAAGALVDFHGIVYDQEKKNQIFAQCHFGLNIMKANVCVGLTMKSMDYFEAGLPIINNIKGDTWDIIERNKFGVNYPFDIDKVAEICDNGMLRKREREYFDSNFSEKAFFASLDKIMKEM